MGKIWKKREIGGVCEGPKKRELVFERSLMANGNTIKYVQILNDLYMDNGLEAQDFTRFLNQ